MRDGTKLFTAIYYPKNTSGKYPILMVRTPYSSRPYGEGSARGRLGPSSLFKDDEYIYVFQDVRGRYMSEGKFEEMTPNIAVKKTKKDTDESSDTYDTIEWLLANIKNNNGKVGIYGISYPGFYATASLPNSHPAIKAVSPQAPVTDEFEGDDAYHRGAFYLMDNYSFMNDFDYPRGDTTWTAYPNFCEQGIASAYTDYLKLGPIKNANVLCFKNRSKIWNEYLQHETKDEYWQARNIRTHLQNIKPAVLVVGGWFDAEDLFGSLSTYKAIETKNPANNNRLIMGPWSHGAWSRGKWNGFGTHDFTSNTNEYYQKMEYDFFAYYLKGSGTFKAAEATIFETGSNKWKEYATWPPKNTKPVTWYLANNKTLSFKTITSSGFDQYTSDPADPVPYLNTTSSGRENEYMIADQKFASERKDVLTYQSQVLQKDVTLAGPITADLFVSTSGTDADFVVKVIDVLPEDAANENGRNVSGMQRLVRAEVLRGKFRNSFIKPEPFVPGKITTVHYQLNDVDHCFLKGHKIMVQIQSSWFPLVDRNPQKFMTIADADEKDFQAASIRIYHDAQHPSAIKVLQLEK